MDMNNAIQNDIRTRYLFVIEETTRETNRVLASWKSSDKIITYQDTQSLFRTNLSKFLKHKFTWQVFERYIKPSNPIATIDSKEMIIDISFNSLYENEHLRLLKEVINEFNFLEFHYSNKKNIDKRPTDDEIINVILPDIKSDKKVSSELINFDNIKQIKFN